MKPPSIIIIIIDTLRKDYAKLLEDVLIKNGFVSYENAIVPASWTTPSHASILTGLYPIIHGAHETKDRKFFDVKLKHNKNLLSEVLHDFGYETYLLSANPLVNPLFGFSGFDYVYEISYVPNLSLLSRKDANIIQKLKQELAVDARLKLSIALIKMGYYLLLFKGVCSELLKPILYWYNTKIKNWPLDKGANEIIKRFKKIISEQDANKFIFINLMEVHDPYFIGENTFKNLVENLRANKLDGNFVKKWRENYPKEVQYVTKKIMEIIKLLRNKGVFEKSLIIVTSDHGQLLGDYGRISHGYFLYDELIKVPLLIKYPKDLNLNPNINNCTFEKKYKYISLTEIKSLICSILNNNLEKLINLYQDTAFAESYGIVHDVKDLVSGKELEKMEKDYEKHRIAIYYKYFKGIFNVTDWKFEEIISYNPQIKVTGNIAKHMRKVIVRFLKTEFAKRKPKYVDPSYYEKKQEIEEKIGREKEEEEYSEEEERLIKERLRALGYLE